MWFGLSHKSRPAGPARPRLEALEGRLCPSGGLLDPTFGSGGVVTQSLSANYDKAYDVAVQADGKIVAAGYSQSDKNGVDYAVARFNADGAPDTTFGTGGVVTTNIKYNDNGRAVAVQADGKLLVAGWAAALSGSRQPADFAVVRYTASGALDTTFGSKGKAVTDLGSDADLAFDMAVQADGKIVVAGMTTALGYNSVALVRYTPSGALDSTFGSGGKLVTTVASLGSNASTTGHSVAVALGSSGRIVVGATTPGGDFTVARFLPGGQTDSTFGWGGVVTTDLAGGNDRLNAITLQPDGKIVAVGQAPGGTFGVARFNPDGSLDSGFDGDGKLTVVPAADTGGFATDVAIQTDGKILLGGPSGGPSGDVDFALIRLNPDGSPDTSYGPLGTGGVMTPIGNYALPGALALEADGRAVLAGFAETGSYPDFALARYLPSGPQIGSFAATPNPVTAGDLVTLTAGGITDGNTGATVTQVAFYADSNGDGKLDPATDTVLGYGSLNADGTWSLTFSTAGWAAGTYTLFAQATDSYGALGDPVSLTLQVV